MTALSDYRLLGRSGLRISPLALGTMTFGDEPGDAESESRRVFDAYVDRGGNFIDTAGYYNAGRSEELLGSFIQGKRNHLILSTKYSLAVRRGDPNAGGNSRKSMICSVEDSLRRLQTDYVDILFLHMWDNSTPADEILRAFDDLVRQGKILYIAVSDTPAWQISRLQMMADLRGWSQFIALQAEYSLLQRTTERDLIPMASEMGLGVMPWSPLRGGLLSGKYATGAGDSSSLRRQHLIAAGRVTPEAIAVADGVQAVANELRCTSAELAIAWTLANPDVAAPLIGARSLQQLEDNLGALNVNLSEEYLARLNQLSAVAMGFPHEMLASEAAWQCISGGTNIHLRN